MSNLYDQMINQMDKGAYTSVKAKETINAFLAQQQITVEEYESLMKKAESLDVNPSDTQLILRVVKLEESVTELAKTVESIKAAVESGGMDVPDPDTGTEGSQDAPIEASRGMTYYKDKYYRDPDDSQTYLCTRDSDTDPGTGVQLAYLPHELVGIYFTLSDMSEGEQDV